MIVASLVRPVNVVNRAIQNLTEGGIDFPFTHQRHLCWTGPDGIAGERVGKTRDWLHIISNVEYHAIAMRLFLGSAGWDRHEIATEDFSDALNVGGLYCGDKCLPVGYPAG